MCATAGEAKHTVTSMQYASEWTLSSIWYWVWGRRQKVRAEGKYLHYEYCCGLSALPHTRAWSPKATIVSYATLQSTNAQGNVPSTSRTAIHSTGSHSLHREKLRSNSFFTAVATQLAKGDSALKEKIDSLGQCSNLCIPTAAPTYSTFYPQNWREIQTLHYCNVHHKYIESS